MLKHIVFMLCYVSFLELKHILFISLYQPKKDSIYYFEITIVNTKCNLNNVLLKYEKRSLDSTSGLKL